MKLGEVRSGNLIDDERRGKGRGGEAGEKKSYEGEVNGEIKRSTKGRKRERERECVCER